ncbi:MAG: arginine--tRNA ligase [Candidatus Omnitrophota bacterium]|nr:arginine--tRNA ligase [Candidatus Omnitrophota bacterium]
MLGKDVSKRITKNLLEACKKYFQVNLPDSTFPDNVDAALQLTRDAKHGDLTSNIAMRLASSARVPPAELGEGIIAVFRDMAGKAGLLSLIGKIELKTGYINFWLSDEYFLRLLMNIHDLKDRFGRSDEGRGAAVNLEFVSANPTGPLTIAHGRQAAIGDALSRILRFNGFKVTSEYYLNDVGRQISLLGKSVEVRYRNLFGKDEPMPEDGYLGDYIIEIAGEIKTKKGKDLLKSSPSTDGFFRDYAVKYMMKRMKDDLKDFGVEFDAWTSQAALEERGEVETVLAVLEKKGYIYESEGAKWFASTKFGDDKDRVVRKSDGSYTYLAPDIAYHRDKFERGYTKLIDLLGPDHHGYIKRMKAAVQALGHDKGSLDILIIQLVTLLRGQEAVSMSTRAGEFVSIRQLIEEIGRDVTRFFFLSRRLDSHLDFDIDLAKKGSADNPVYYIQYAHARICSIKKYSRGKLVSLLFHRTRLELLKAKEENKLIRKLAEFPFAVRSSADLLEPNRIIVYLNELSRVFHSFYTECRVVSDDIPLSKARLFLVECTRIVLANGLRLLNITMPEKM